jgi:hypothetical protein
MKSNIYINNTNRENSCHNTFKLININNIGINNIMDIIDNLNIDLILTNYCFNNDLYQEIINKKCKVILCNISNKIISKEINIYIDELTDKKNRAIEKYYPKSNLDDYLLIKHLPLYANLTKKRSNAFDIDLKFFCYVNDIIYDNKINILNHFNSIGLNGLIYHPQQLFNIFGDNINILIEDNSINILYKNTNYDAKDFVRRFIYESSFEDLSQLLIEKSFDNLNSSNETILLVFIANKDIGIELLNKIINYKNTINNEFNLAVCINKNIDNSNSSNIIKLITDNFEFYSIYYSRESGQDITPTLLMYDDLKKKYNKIKHVFKFHTKSDRNMFLNLTDYLLTNSLETILNSKRHDCNCIGNPHYYKSVAYHIDDCNNSLKEKYINLININNCFVVATIFYTENSFIEKVIEFVKENNFKAYLLNNLYDTNWINQQYSPNHFLERLFGVIKI